MFTKHTARNAQSDLLTAFEDWVQNNKRMTVSFEGKQDNKRALAYMATGVGKTLGCVMCIDKFKDLDSNKRVLVLTNMGVLYTNMENTLKNFKAIESSTWTINAVDGKTSCNPTDDVVLASIQTFYNQVSKAGGGANWLNGFKPDLVIIDEAHHYLEEQKWGECISNLGVPVLNFTATPFDNMGFPIKGLGEVLVNYPMGRCTAGGLLVPIDVSTIRLDNLKNSSTKELEAILSSSDLINELIKLTQGCNKVLINGVSIPHINAVADALNASCGSTAAYTVHSKLSKSDNSTRIQNFTAGKFKYLLSYKMLGEGFDCPDVDAVVLLRNLSDRKNPLVRDEIQFIGRGRRLSSGKTKCKVIQLQDTLDRMYSVIPMPTQSEYVMMINDAGKYIPIGDAILSSWKDSKGIPLTWNQALPYLQKNVKMFPLTPEYIAATLRGQSAFLKDDSSQKWDRIHNNWTKKVDSIGLVLALDAAGYTHEKLTKDKLKELSYIQKHFKDNSRNNVELAYNLKQMGLNFSGISGHRVVIDSRRVENRYLLFLPSENGKPNVRSITKKEFDHFYSKGGSRLDLSNNMIGAITSFFNGETRSINRDIKNFTKDVHKELQNYKEVTSNPEVMSNLTEKIVLVAKSIYNSKVLSTTKVDLLKIIASDKESKKPTKVLNALDAIIKERRGAISRIQER